MSYREGRILLHAGASEAGASQDSMFSPDAPGKWHLLRTKSRQEKALSETLERIITFCPW